MVNYVEWQRAQSVPAAAPPEGGMPPLGDPDPFEVQEGLEDGPGAQGEGLMREGDPEGSEYAPSDHEDDPAALDAEDIN